MKGLRKFTVAFVIWLGSFVLCCTKHIDGQNYVAVAALVMALFDSANAAQKALPMVLPEPASAIQRAARKLFGWRKFSIAMLFVGSGFLLCFLGRLDGNQYVSLTGWVCGLFGATSVAGQAARMLAPKEGS
jgi:hypothetical protein